MANEYNSGESDSQNSIVPSKRAAKSAVPTTTSISNLVSRYQTSIGIESLLGSAQPHELPAQETRPKSTGLSESEFTPITGSLQPEHSHSEPRSVSVGPQETVQAHISKFQQVFDSRSKNIAPVPLIQTTSDAKKANFSRASISALINLDESVPVSETAQRATTQIEKRKRASSKVESAAKKAKSDDSKKTVKASLKRDTGVDTRGDNKRDSKADITKDTAKKTVKAEAKTDVKKVSKAKKKTPEVILPSQDKPSIHPTMTTERARTPAPSVNVPPPSFIAMDDVGSGEIGIGRSGDDKERPQLPVIALEIPLLDPKHPKPGQAEVVVNVLRLAEEKYGWSTVHPEARSALELMDEVLDDEDEGDEEEDEEVMIVDEEGNSLRKKDDGTNKKKKKSQSSQTKVNRKVGKYDFEDPFIDDAELQWEEEITTTKEGFFVYWGPLVDERQPTKKSTAKSKK